MDGREASLLLICFLAHANVKKEEETRESGTEFILAVRVNYIWAFPGEFHLDHFFPPRILHML